MLKLTSSTILSVGAVFVTAVWTSYAHFICDPQDGFGVFGDSFGALNCLFTGLASVGVVAALWHEREIAQKDQEKEMIEAAQAKEEAAIRERQHCELLDAMRKQAEANGVIAKITALRDGLKTTTAFLENNRLVSDPETKRLVEEAKNQRRRMLNELGKVTGAMMS